MSILAIYAISLIIFISIYLFSSNQLKLNDFKETYAFINKSILTKALGKKDYEQDLPLVDQDYSMNLILDKNLKHLDFINQLESYIETTNSSVISIEFLKEFEASKLHAQRAIIKSTQLLNINCKSAA